MRLPCLSSPLVLAVSLAGVMLAGCADDPVVPPPGAPGDYHATRFALSTTGQPINLLAAGASLSISLGDDHQTSGRLQIPAAVTGGIPLDQSLAGTWRQSHDTVFFSGTADTFVRDVPFLLRGATLVADQTRNGTRLQVTLAK